MELNHLKYFYFVAKEGGFTKAAKALQIAQSAVSKMVKNLENELKVELFEATGRSIRLTPSGTDLFRKCEVIFEQLQDIEATLKPKSNTISGQLKFGCAEVIAAYLVPNAVQKALERHPPLQTFITTSTASELCSLLLAKKLDFVLAFHLPELPPELEVRKIYPMPFHLAVATDKVNSNATCSTFIGSREVDDTATKTYPTLKLLQEKFPKASIKISTNSLSAHKRLVQLGVGVSILPEFMIKDEIESGKLKSLLKEREFTFNMKLVCRKSQPLSAAAQVFLEGIAY